MKRSLRPPVNNSVMKIITGALLIFCAFLCIGVDASQELKWIERYMEHLIHDNNNKNSNGGNITSLLFKNTLSTTSKAISLPSASSLASQVQQAIFSLQSMYSTPKSSLFMNTATLPSNISALYAYAYSYTNTKLPTVTPTPTRLFNRNDSLVRVVFETVLPPGLARPKKNVVFEYSDEVEDKTCRCICRFR